MWKLYLADFMSVWRTLYYGGKWCNQRLNGEFVVICFLYRDCMEGFMINEKTDMCQFCIMSGINVEMYIRI